MCSFRILAINPGSTSTKIALFEDEREMGNNTQRFTREEVDVYPTIMDQEEFRLEAIEHVLRERNRKLEEIDAFVGRGGLLRPIDGGTYRVNDEMIADLVSEKYGAHACNLGAVLARRLASEAGGKEAFIVDPVVVDEMIPEARLSGLPEIERRSIFHALNQKAIARRAAAEIGRTYEEVNLIVAHMGGGISVGAHLKGRVVDVNNALDGEGPFSPERGGAVPAGELARLAFSGSFSFDDLMRKLVGQGGMMAHLGTSDLRVAQQRADEGDEKAQLILEAMAYQISREIGAKAAVLSGQVDAVALTGGLAYGERFVELIRRRVAFIAPVRVYPGEDEMKALAEGALRVLRGEEEPRQYRAL